MTWAVLVAAFAAAIVYDVLSIRWTRAAARDATTWRAYGAGIALAIALEALRWLPILFAIRTGDASLALVSVAGSAVGNAVALPRPSARNLHDR